MESGRSAVQMVRSACVDRRSDDEFMGEVGSAAKYSCAIDLVIVRS